MLGCIQRNLVHNNVLHSLHVVYNCIHVYIRLDGRVVYTCSSFFLGKGTALGVLCCFALFVCLTLLASFFLPSHLSFKNMYVCM